jgi:CMP-N,N'-diacetyllegionaminic acid synthase
MNNIFIIPARAGSKGIEDKNIQLVGKLPLFVWSIVHAKYLADEKDIICVSSDSEDYLKVAEKWGVDIRKRSSNLSTDNAPTESVMEDVINQYRLDEEDNIFLLQPTSPLRSKETLNKFIELINKNAESILTVRETNNFEWINVTKDIYKPMYSSRPMRQDTSPKYEENGSVYCTKLKTFNKYKNRVNDKSNIVVQNEIESIDVDTASQLKLVQSISEIFNSQWEDEISNHII